jgi:hypothetical protein
MRAVNKSENFISLAVEEGETLTIAGRDGTQLSIAFPEECLFNCYRKNVSKPLQISGVA